MILLPSAEPRQMEHYSESHNTRILSTTIDMASERVIVTLSVEPETDIRIAAELFHQHILNLTSDIINGMDAAQRQRRNVATTLEDAQMQLAACQRLIGIHQASCDREVADLNRKREEDGLAWSKALDQRDGARKALKAQHAQHKEALDTLRAHKAEIEIQLGLLQRRHAEEVSRGDKLFGELLESRKALLKAEAEATSANAARKVAEAQLTGCRGRADASERSLQHTNNRLAQSTARELALDSQLQKARAEAKAQLERHSKVVQHAAEVTFERDNARRDLEELKASESDEVARAEGRAARLAGKLERVEILLSNIAGGLCLYAQGEVGEEKGGAKWALGALKHVVGVINKRHEAEEAAPVRITFRTPSAPVAWVGPCPRCSARPCSCP